MLYDNHGRIINYMRLAVTDRCNLRCFYCMPEEGIQYVQRQELLTYEEMERIVTLGYQLGIRKVRITGGEPFLRKGIMDFLERISQLPELAIHVTTNGTLTYDLVPKLKNLGIKSINLSLDSLDEKRFYEITRRDSFKKVMQTFEQLLAYEIPTKLNAVVMAGKNIDDILPMVALTKELPIGVRFIEEMPFNGKGSNGEAFEWDYRKILDHIKTQYPSIAKIKDPKYSTSLNYQIPDHKGTVGIIAAYSRLFCGSCNRIRLTPQGVLKTCLYDNGVFNIRDLIRAGASNEQVQEALQEALAHRAKDGHEAERKRKNNPVQESMATIGG